MNLKNDECMCEYRIFRGENWKEKRILKKNHFFFAELLHCQKKALILHHVFGKAVS